jgi:hypothetical protein
LISNRPPGNSDIPRSCPTSQTSWRSRRSSCRVDGTAVLGFRIKWTSGRALVLQLPLTTKHKDHLTDTVVNHLDVYIIQLRFFFDQRNLQ